MHHVGHWAAIRDADVAGDDGAAKAGGDEITVVHAGAADDPGGLIGKAADNKGVFGGGLDQRWIKRFDQNFGTAGGDKPGFPACYQHGIIGEDAQAACAGADGQAQAQAMTGHDGDAGIIGGKDTVKPEAEGFLKKPKVTAQVMRGKLRFGTDILHGGPFASVGTG
jgi:hypothetical protein